MAVCEFCESPTTVFCNPINDERPEIELCDHVVGYRIYDRQLDVVSIEEGSTNVGDCYNWLHEIPAEDKEYHCDADGSRWAISVTYAYLDCKGGRRRLSEFVARLLDLENDPERRLLCAEFGIPFTMKSADIIPYPRRSTDTHALHRKGLPTVTFESLEELETYLHQRFGFRPTWNPKAIQKVRGGGHIVWEESCLVLHRDGRELTFANSVSLDRFVRDRIYKKQLWQFIDGIGAVEWLTSK